MKSEEVDLHRLHVEEILMLIDERQQTDENVVLSEVFRTEIRKYLETASQSIVLPLTVNVTSLDIETPHIRFEWYHPDKPGWEVRLVLTDGSFAFESYLYWEYQLSNTEESVRYGVDRNPSVEVFCQRMNEVILC